MSGHPYRRPMSWDDGKRYWTRMVRADNQLSSTAKVVAAALAERHNCATGQCNPGYKTLMDDTGLARQTISDAMQELERFGLIERNRDHASNSFEYILTLPNHPMRAPSDNARKKEDRPLVFGTPGIRDTADGGSPGTKKTKRHPEKPSDPIRDTGHPIRHGGQGYPECRTGYPGWRTGVSGMADRGVRNAGPNTEGNTEGNTEQNSQTNSEGRNDKRGIRHGGHTLGCASLVPASGEGMRSAAPRLCPAPDFISHRPADGSDLTPPANPPADSLSAAELQEIYDMLDACIASDPPGFRDLARPLSLALRA